MMLREPGGDQVADLAPDSAISSVNLSEAADFYARQGMPRALLTEMFGELPLQIIPADREQAIDAAMLRPLTSKAGLSLGDRYCLALAKRLNCEALTTDRAWLKVADEIGVRIKVIR
jgi:PIN domain nuclease of toxin-antitoxin system